MSEKLKILIRYIWKYKMKGLFLFINIYLFKARSVTLPVFGKILLRTDSSDPAIFTQVFIHCQYDLQLEGPVKVIVDLGGNNGMSARYFRFRYPQATIYVLEPDADNFRALQENTSGLSNVIPLMQAIWKEDGFIFLNNDDSWAIKVDMEAGVKKARSVTMETFLTENGIQKIDLLKIDIESAEKEVFEHSGDFLSITDNLIIELHDWIKPGCASAFFEKVARYTYNYSIRSENTLLRNIKRVV